MNYVIYSLFIIAAIHFVLVPIGAGLILVCSFGIICAYTACLLLYLDKRFKKLEDKVDK